MYTFEHFEFGIEKIIKLWNFLSSWGCYFKVKGKTIVYLAVKCKVLCNEQ